MYPQLISRILCGVVVVAALLASLPSPALAQYSQQRGATLGGLGGAAAGAIIGDHNGEAGAGAAIGGVIGAITGGLLGNAADKEAALRSQQHAYYHQQQQAAVTQSTVSVADVVSMSRSGLGENVIINHIHQRGVSHSLQVADIIALHQQGVSENVITAMQQAHSGAPRGRSAPATFVAQPPVIVEEHIMVPHYPPPRVYHYHRPPMYRHHSGLHLRF